MELVSVVLRDAWSRLHNGVRGYRSMTNPQSGMPSERVERTLFSRIFSSDVHSALKRETRIDTTVATQVMDALVEGGQTLRATAGWHRALNRAYQQYYRAGGERFLGGDAIEPLFVPAWDLAREPQEGEPEEIAGRVILELSTGSYTWRRVQRALADPVFAAELNARLEELWATQNGVTAPAQPSAALMSNVKALLVELGRAKGLNGALEPAMIAVAEQRWTSVVTDPGADRAVAAQALGLTVLPVPERPQLTSEADDGTNTSPKSIGNLAFRALDESVQARLQRILTRSLAADDERLIARRAVELTAEAYGLADAPARLTLIVGALAFAGVTASAAGSNEATGSANGITEYFARRWRTSSAVRDKVRRPGDHYSDTILYIENPLEYLLGRLWIRLYRTAFTGPSAALEASWMHIHGAFTTALKSVNTPTGKLVKSGFREETVPAVADDDSDDSAPYSAETVFRVDGRVEIDRMLASVATPSVQAILGRAARVHGAHAVEQLVSSIPNAVSPNADASARARVTEIFERWVRELAIERLSGATGGERLASAAGAEREALLDRAVAALPSFDQFVVQSMARARARGPRRAALRSAEMAELYAPSALLEFVSDVEDGRIVAEFVRSVRARAVSDDLADRWNAWSRALSNSYAQNSDIPGDAAHHARLMPTLDDLAEWISQEGTPR